MSRLPVAGANNALAGIFGQSTTNAANYLALNTSDPGTATSTATSSENANAGGYARAALSMNAPSASAITNSAQCSYTTAGTSAVGYVSGFNSSTYGGGAYGIGGQLSASVTSTSIIIAAGGLTVTAS